MNVAETIAAIETKLEDVTDLRERIDVLVELGWHYLNVDTHKALRLGEQALELSTAGDEAGSYERGRLYSLRNMSKCLSVLGDYVRAMPIAMELVGAAMAGTIDPVLRGHALSVLGYCYFRLGDYPQSLEMHFEALKTAEEHGLEDIRSRSLDYVGFIYVKLGKPAEAITYHKRAVELCPDDLSWQAFGHNNLACAYIDNQEYDTALVHAMKSLDLGRNHNVARVLPHVLDTIGLAYQKKGEIQTAIQYFEEAAECASKTCVKAAEIDALHNLGSAYASLGNQDERALMHLRRGLELAVKLEAKPQMIVCHEVLSGILARQGELAAALEHHRQFAKLEREVFSEQADQKLKTLQVVHDTENAKKEAEIHRLKNIELQTALDKVKLLSGLLPICAWCKRIRDDGGYWDQIEMYIDKHSEAEFSHSICPDCLQVQHLEKAATGQ